MVLVEERTKKKLKCVSSRNRQPVRGVCEVSELTVQVGFEVGFDLYL